jgi:hypothetical protein
MLDWETVAQKFHEDFRVLLPWARGQDDYQLPALLEKLAEFESKG